MFDTFYNCKCMIEFVISCHTLVYCLMFFLLLMIKGILGDPGADSEGERKSKRAKKYIWNEEK